MTKDLRGSRSQLSADEQRQVRAMHQQFLDMRIEPGLTIAESREYRRLQAKIVQAKIDAAKQRYAKR